MEVTKSTEDKNKKVIKSHRNPQTIHQKQKSNFTRMKSQQQQQNDIQSKIRQKINQKPRSSLSKRVPSQSKHTQTMNSLTTTSSGKSQTQVRTLVCYSLAHNPKVKEFLKQIHLNDQQAKQKLLNNQIFILSLINYIGSNKSTDETNGIVQKQLIKKLNRIIIFEKQIKNCLQRQNKITSLIDSRLRALSCFHQKR